MLTIKQITDDKEGVIKGLEKKHFAGAREAIDAVLRQNDLRRETQGKLDTLLQAMNAKSKEIGALMREGKREEAEAAKAEVAAKKEEYQVYLESHDAFCSQFQTFRIRKFPKARIPMTMLLKKWVVLKNRCPKILFHIGSLPRNMG